MESRDRNRSSEGIKTQPPSECIVAASDEATLAEMNLATWVFESGKIWLRLADGTQVRPPAGDIFRAAFREQRVVSGHDVKSPLDDLPELSFSRLPAQVAVRISGSIFELSVELGVVADSTFAKVPVRSDSIVTANRWYPIVLKELADAALWLEGRNIDPATSSSIGAWIALRFAADPPFKLVDDLSPKQDAREWSAKVSQRTSLPAALKADLYPYQKVGVAFLSAIARENIGCVLADEMGLGKTLQLIALLVSEKALGHSTSLVVTPATLLENWKREFLQFAPTMDVLIHAGSERAGVAARLLSYDVVVMSYDTAVRDLPMLGEVSWNILALDEAQNIKNPDALRTISIKALRRRVSIAITGTPLENSINDLWSLCDFSLKGLLGNLDNFRRDFENDLRSADQLSAIISPIILRRRIVDVATDLPELIEVHTHFNPAGCPN